jgi:hypothetical protein
MLGYYKRSLTDLFDQVQAVHRDPDGQAELCLKIQLRLLRSTIHAEQQVRQLRGSIRVLKKRLATPHPRLNESEAKAVRKRISLSQRRMDGYREVLAILRDIGDALAFTYINKWDIKPLAFKESPGFLSEKEGLNRELEALRTVFARGHIGILNDLTNCLRYGDISVVKNGRLVIFEVKSGKSRSRRTDRQSRKAREITEYLTTDRTKRLYNMEGEFRRISTHSQETDHSSALNTLIAQAMAQGTATATVENGLHYIVVATHTSQALDLVETVGGKCKGKPIIAVVNEIIHANQGYWPFTLSISSSEALYRFYSNALTILVLVDSEVIEETFRAHGLQTELNLDENWAVRLSSTGPTDDEWIAAGISRHLFGRLFAEFLSLHWLLEEAIHKGEQLEI